MDFYIQNQRRRSADSNPTKPGTISTFGQTARWLWYIVVLKSVPFGMFCQVLYLLRSSKICKFHFTRAQTQRVTAKPPARCRAWDFLPFGFIRYNSGALLQTCALTSLFGSCTVGSSTLIIPGCKNVKIVTPVPTGSPKWLVSPVRYAIEMPDLGALIETVWRHGWSQVMVCRL